METCMHNVKLTQTCVVCCRYAGATEASLATDPPPTLSRDNLPSILWCATGMSEFFLSKEDCERALRVSYPDESVDRRYARIYYKRLYRHTLYRHTPSEMGDIEDVEIYHRRSV